MVMRKIFVTTAVAAFGLCAGLPGGDAPLGAKTPVLGFATAAAQQPVGQNRRVARRTARRTTRRNTYINTLPAGCVRRNAYWYCGGIYYQPVVQDGRTVYVVVNL